MVSRDPGTKVNQIREILARPLTLLNFIALGQTMYEKRVTIFLNHSVFWHPNGIFWFSSLGLMYSKALSIKLPNFVPF